MATNGFSKTTNLQHNDRFEMNRTREYIQGRRPNIAARKVRVSRSKGQFIIANPGYAGCLTYATLGSGTNCNCAQFATRTCHYFTGEDMRHNYPQRVSNYINRFNSESGYANQGNHLN